MTDGYQDPRPGGPHRDAELIAWLASTGRSQNQFSSGELRAMLEGWEAARARYAPAGADVPETRAAGRILAERIAAQLNGPASDGRGWFRDDAQYNEITASVSELLDDLGNAGYSITVTGAEAPAAPVTEEDWRARVDRVLQLYIGLLDPELCDRTARFLAGEAWLITGKPALDDRHVLLIAKAVATETSRRYADLDWQERWNHVTAVAALTQSGPDVVATGMFGVLRFRLDRPADVAAIVASFRQFTGMIEEAGRQREAGGQYIARDAQEHELAERWQEPEFPYPEDEDSPGVQGG
jgi:hypothetical protein